MTDAFEEACLRVDEAISDWRQGDCLSSGQVPRGRSWRSSRLWRSTRTTYRRSGEAADPATPTSRALLTNGWWPISTER